MSGSNKLYAVVSETLYETIDILGYGQGPTEPYCIVEIVAAKSREQARYLAWQTDRNFDGDCREMPNFRTCYLGRTRRPKGILDGSVSSLDRYWRMAHKKSKTLFRGA